MTTEVSAYVSSARRLSLLVLLVAALGSQVALEHRDRSLDLATARGSFAKDYSSLTMNERLFDSDGSMTKSWERHAAKVGELMLSDLRTHSEQVLALPPRWVLFDSSLEPDFGTIQTLLGWQWVRAKVTGDAMIEHVIIYPEISARLRVTEKNGATWSAPVFSEAGLDPYRMQYQYMELDQRVLYAFIDNMQRSDPEGGLKQLALKYGLSLSTNRPWNDKAELIKAFQRVHRENLSHNIQLPAAPVVVPATTAMWAFAISCLVLLVVIRSRVMEVRQHPSLGSGEPWLVLDARRGIERVLGYIWIGAMLLAGPTLSAFLIMTIKARRAADGVEYGSLTACALALVLFCLAWASLYVGTSATASTLMLRHTRMKSAEK